MSTPKEPKERFLNPLVQAEVQANPLLFVAWRLTHHNTYDWEIDPLHRPEWVKEQQAKEASDLEALKAEIALLKTEFRDGIPASVWNSSALDVFRTVGAPRMAQELAERLNTDAPAILGVSMSATGTKPKKPAL